MSSSDVKSKGDQCVGGASKPVVQFNLNYINLMKTNEDVVYANINEMNKNHITQLEGTW